MVLPEEMNQERRMRVERARSWLERSVAADTEDRVYELFGLRWSGVPFASLAKAREALLAEQRPDGGWGKMRSRPSDAYATGQALAELNQAAGVPASHPAYQRGQNPALCSRWQRDPEVGFEAFRISYNAALPTRRPSPPRVAAP